jgi:starch synthase
MVGSGWSEDILSAGLAFSVEARALPQLTSSPLPALLVSPDFLPGTGLFNGRRWAANRLLQQWGAMAHSSPVALLGADPAHLSAYQQQLHEGGHSGAVQSLSFTDPTGVARHGALFTPDPALGLWSRWRWAAGPAAFSIIGQTHTLASTAALSHLDALGADPLNHWDALICSSSAGQVVASQLLEARLEQLAQRFGIDLGLAEASKPQLPVIPLPIDVAGLQSALPDRLQARQQLAIPEQASVLLWIGRLSLLTKLDPWPQYQMLERLAQRLPGPLVLLELGPDDTEQQASHFRELRALCPSVQFRQLGGVEPVAEAVKHQALAAADLALSLVDNVQETFGLAVAEAMAAGLPVVASNWDGYRDSVRDGVDGFLVPTRWAMSAPAVSPGLGWLHQIGVVPYTAFAGALGQLVSVDMEAAAESIAVLLLDPLLLRCMGAAAARRARERFDTPVISASYQRLFAELEQRRLAAQADARHRQPPGPWRAIDPVSLFGHFASHSAKAIRPDVSEPVPTVIQGRQGLWSFLQMATPAEQHGELRLDLFAKHR